MAVNGVPQVKDWLGEFDHSHNDEDYDPDLLRDQPDAMRNVTLMSGLSIPSMFEEEAFGAATRALLDAPEDVARELPFSAHATSQLYQEFRDESSLRAFEAFAPEEHAGGALLGLPPLELDSIMIRGENGICRWSTIGRELQDDTTGAQRTDGHALDRRDVSRGAIDVHQLLSEYHATRSDAEEQREVAEAHRRKRQRDEDEARLTSSIERKAAGPAEGSDLWVSRYRPRGFKELLSDESANLSIVQWMVSWKDYVYRGASKRGKLPQGPKLKKQDMPSVDQAAMLDAVGQQVSGPVRPQDRLLLIVGPPGVGKTTLAHVIAHHCGYEAREINASSDRTVSVIDGIITDAVANSAIHVPLNGVASSDPAMQLLLPKCLIIDEMDGIHANVVQLLLKKDIHRPVLCLANNLYAPALRDLRSGQVRIIHVPPISPQRLISRLEYIVAKETMDVDRGTLAELVHVSNGDIRCCLNTLQFLRRAPGARVSAAEVQRAMAQLRGKDATLGLWPLWNETFVKKEKSKYASLLKSEFHQDWAVLSTGAAGGSSEAAALPLDNTRRKHCRVDPGFYYVSKKLSLCADVDTLLDGLFQHYPMQKYSDYSLEKTQRCVDVFGLHDIITAHGYANNNVGMSEKFGLVTGAACFAYCSSLQRMGTPLSFPREALQFREMQLQSLETARAFTSKLPGPLAAMYESTSVVALDVAPLLTRSLLNAQIKIPKHSLTSVKSLGPTDQRLFNESVNRHVEYGLTYAADQSGRVQQRRYGSSSDHHQWALLPRIDTLGCVSSGRAQSSTRSPSPALAAPSGGGGAGWTPQPPPLVTVLRDEVKQLIAGECNSALIRRRQDFFVKEASASQRESSSKTVPLAAATTPAVGDVKKEVIEPKKQQEPVSRAPHIEITPSKKKTVKRDFFGRPIVAALPPPPPAIPGTPPPATRPSSAEPQKHVETAAKKSLPPTHPVKYVFFDGSTNAVKLPASLQDFL